MSNDARIMTSLPAHPKTRKLIRRHGQAAGWNLICLFLFARDNKPDGDFSGMDAEDIELAADWQGVAGEFVASLIDVGFLDEAEHGYQIHGWAEHNPWAAGAKGRSESAKQNAAKRWAKRYGMDANGINPDAVGINPHSEPHESALPPLEIGNAPYPTPYPTPTPLPKSKTKGRVAPFVLPEQIKPEVWKDWHDYRNTKKGWTAKAKQLSLNTLLALVAKGHNPQKIINTSIERGWTGLFEPKADPKQSVVRPIETRQKPKTPEQLRAEQREANVAFERYQREVGMAV